MKKTIAFCMVDGCAKNYGHNKTKHSLCLVPVEVDTDMLSPASRWVAEHITSTYILDEWRDRNDLIAIAGFSMEERDRKNGVDEETIQYYLRNFEHYYTDPMTIHVTFPYYCDTRHMEPWTVIDTSVNQLIRAGAVKLKDLSTGDEFDLI